MTTTDPEAEALRNVKGAWLAVGRSYPLFFEPPRHVEYKVRIDVVRLPIPLVGSDVDQPVLRAQYPYTNNGRTGALIITVRQGRALVRTFFTSIGEGGGPVTIEGNPVLFTVLGRGQIGYASRLTTTPRLARLDLLDLETFAPLRTA